MFFDFPELSQVSITRKAHGYMPARSIECPITYAEPTLIICALPAGSGKGYVIDVKVGDLNSLSSTVPGALKVFSYAKPTIESLLPNKEADKGGNQQVLALDLHRIQNFLYQS